VSQILQHDVTFGRRRSKLQVYSILDSSLSSSFPSAPAVTPCLAAGVDLGTTIAASAANYHFPCEAAIIASSIDGGKKKLWIWDIEHDRLSAHQCAFDDEDCAFTWADCIWGHHPRSIFCVESCRLKIVDLRSNVVSSAIEIGSRGFLPSGRFYGAHNPRDARVPMIVTTSSSAVSLWDLRYFREPVAQLLHHLEHDPPALIASSFRDCNLDVHSSTSIDRCLTMDVVVCSSRFSYPLLHSVKIGDENSSVTVGLPLAIHGLREAHRLRHSSRALHADGAQTCASATSGMCLLSNSLPKGVRTVAFFASSNGHILLSYARDNIEHCSVEPGPSFLSHSLLKPHCPPRVIEESSHAESAADAYETLVKSKTPNCCSELSTPLSPSADFSTWMTSPRNFTDSTD
jgi:hypothetical protein